MSWDLTCQKLSGRLFDLGKTALTDFVNTEMTILTLGVNLEVIDMLLGIQVNATSLLFDGHHREADVDAAMQFAFLDLRHASS